MESKKSFINKYLSSFILVIANIIPLIVGFFFWNWDVRYFILLYWLEAMIIFFWSVFKIRITQNMWGKNQKKYQEFEPFVLMMLFIFLISLQIFFGFLLEIINIKKIALNEIFFASCFLFLSHGFSFFYNYINKKEFTTTNVGIQVNNISKRFLVLIFVFVFLSTFGYAERLIFIPSKIPNTIVLFIFILTKIFIDWSFHIREHLKTTKL